MRFYHDLCAVPSAFYEAIHEKLSRLDYIEYSASFICNNQSPAYNCV